MVEDRSEQIIHFFQHLDRSLFINNENREYSHQDRALPIGYDQTISQPSLVLQMTLALEIEESSKVLEVGTGSGYQTVLLAEFASRVFSMERVPELAWEAQERVKQMGYDNVRFCVEDGSLGWPTFAPYDRIMVTAAAGKIPQPLLEQLQIGGRMIVPVGPPGDQELLLVTKNQEGTISIQPLANVSFVEFKGRYGWDNQKAADDGEEF
ncbi:MAG TPA: protein-L-isoaspartate(D-aspartate) O-methyltransferase [Syntrophomonadaceae bacterium]|nr:protein-L-isoaspartate(D-aspartate) O-methyltransferase [Syntrophomonadaceae bacterium]